MQAEFSRDVAKLVIICRRALSYSYAIRFYLKGSKKQRFFDFSQKELERSLERLNLINEEKSILDFTEPGLMG